MINNPTCRLRFKFSTPFSTPAIQSGNDNFSGKTNDAGLRFIPVPGKSYLLRASSAQERDLGNYTLSAKTVVPGPKTALAPLAAGGTVSGKLTVSSEIDERYFTFKRDHLLIYNAFLTPAIQS